MAITALHPKTSNRMTLFHLFNNFFSHFLSLSIVFHFLSYFSHKEGEGGLANDHRIMLMLLSNTWKLARDRNHSGLSIVRDLTDKERKREKDLMVEAKRKNLDRTEEEMSKLWGRGEEGERFLFQ